MVERGGGGECRDGSPTPCVRQWLIYHNTRLRTSELNERHLQPTNSLVSSQPLSNHFSKEEYQFSPAYLTLLYWRVSEIIVPVFRSSRRLITKTTNHRRLGCMQRGWWVEYLDQKKRQYHEAVGNCIFMSLADLIKKFPELYLPFYISVFSINCFWDEPHCF
jgi:hypothetical protein